jgi:hypothetical protein
MRARELAGHKGRSWSIDFFPNALTDAADIRDVGRDGFLGRIFDRLPLRYRSLLYGIANVSRYDVMHLYFGQTMLLTNIYRPVWGQMDLPLWKLLGKKVFMTFQGCDARMKSLAAREPISACAVWACQQSHCTPEVDALRVRCIKMISRFCDKLFCLNPDLIAYVPGSEFLPYVNLDVGLLERSHVAESNRPTIVHAPTDRPIKGTSFLENASRDLQRTIPHRLRLVENVPRAQAIEMYAGATVLVDQLLCGWYGGVAVEAMALGIPVVAYLNEKHLQEIPSAMRAEIPIVSATPVTVRDVLAELLQRRGWRQELSERGKSYVLRWHHPVKIARRMLQVYQDPSVMFWDGYDPEWNLG